ncbi:MAG: hypothetical protein PHU91_05185 [Candidatus Omnitrophica bacterium]|nr:hypothetical protein [Candidatus Omnitrophota bacterium]MDD5237038.1 hypothetical protein [Candidatus Omnitrophota bacterium]MDD5611232.1 hypothetical protein [Candidatus Omnitrophota bacterium]
MSKNYLFFAKKSALFLIFCLLAGCISAEKKPDPRKIQVEIYLRTETIKESIRNGQIHTGMRYKELSALLGKPDKVVQVETDRHLDMQWIYEDRTGEKPKYFSFHFQDGALLEWR